MTIIPESNVFRLINGSTLPGARRFKDWMYEEVHSRKAPLEIERADEPATQEIPESPEESDRPDGINYWLANDEPSTSLIALEFDGQQIRTVMRRPAGEGTSFSEPGNRIGTIGFRASGDQGPVW